MTRLSRYNTSLGVSHNPTSNYIPTSSSYLKNHGYFSTPKPYNRLAGEETTATNTLDKSGETAEKVRRKESDLDEDKTISHNAIRSKDIASLDIVQHDENGNPVYKYGDKVCTVLRVLLQCYVTYMIEKQEIYIFTRKMLKLKILLN